MKKTTAHTLLAIAVTLLLTIPLHARGEEPGVKTTQTNTKPLRLVQDEVSTKPIDKESKQRETYSDGSCKWTTADSIAVRYYGAYAAEYRGNAQLPAAQPSRDGLYFFVSNLRGDVSCECTVQTLEVFDTQQVRRWLAGRESDAAVPLPPVQTVEKRAPSPQAMTEVRWSEVGTAIEFVALDADGRSQQLYRLEVPSGKVRALTKEPLEKYFFYVRGNTILYRRDVPQSAAAAPRSSVVVAPRNAAGDIQFPLRRATFRPEWVASYRGGEPWVLPIGEVYAAQAWISPDERRAVILLKSNRMLPQRFMLVDFVRKQVQPLGDVAGGRWQYEVQAFWTADGRQAILVGSALPAGLLPAVSKSAEAAHVVAYDVEADRWQILEALPELDMAAQTTPALGWLKAGEEFLITHETGGKVGNGTVYARQGNRWVGRSVPASHALPPAKVVSLPDGLTVKVQQSANDPPVLMAADGHHQRALSKPDPALEGVWRARVEPFTWRMADGQSVTGGLSLPRLATAGTPVPLVIQVSNGYDPDVFLPDGEVPVGYARQALVAHGMAVLEINGFDLPGGLMNPREGANFVARFDAAVEALARQGTIDPQRVGVIGHSHTGYQTHYAVTHPGRVRLAAAEVWDAATVSYAEYLAYVPIEGTYASDFEKMNGGPFWQNKAAWLEHDVLFNADRAETPTLFVDNGRQSRTAEETRASALATIAAWRLNRRPLEYLFFPDGGHVLARVREHKPAMDATVDWMGFWLQGREDPSSAKAEQYARWRLIRQRDEERKAEEAASASTPAK